MTNSDIFKKWLAQFSKGKNLNISLVFYFKVNSDVDDSFWQYDMISQGLIACKFDMSELSEFVQNGYCCQTIYDGLEITMYYKNCINVSSYTNSANYVKTKNTLKNSYNDGFSKMYCSQKDIETVLKFSTDCIGLIEMVPERLTNVETKTIDLTIEFCGMYNFDGSKMGFVVPVELYKIAESDYKFKLSFNVKKDGDMRLYSVRKNKQLISHLYRGPDVLAVYTGMKMNTDKLFPNKVFESRFMKYEGR